MSQNGGVGAQRDSEGQEVEKVEIIDKPANYDDRSNLSKNQSKLSISADKSTKQIRKNLGNQHVQKVSKALQKVKSHNVDPMANKSMTNTQQDAPANVSTHENKFSTSKSSIEKDTKVVPKTTKKNVMHTSAHQNRVKSTVQQTQEQ